MLDFVTSEHVAIHRQDPTTRAFASSFTSDVFAGKKVQRKAMVKREDLEATDKESPKNRRQISG